MGAPESTPNGFTRVMQKAYNPLGFKKFYNFTLCKKSTLLLTTVPHSSPVLQGLSLLELS